MQPTREKIVELLKERGHATVEEFADIAAKAGFEVSDVWMDGEHLFSVQYLTMRT